MVGRILDWYQRAHEIVDFPPNADPGVLSVTRIYNYYKRHGYQTQVMAAGLRNVEEIFALAGCDYLTIAPDLLRELRHLGGDVVRKLDAQTAKTMDIPKVSFEERDFRWGMNEDPMASEKLGEGIRLFAADARRLEVLAYESGHAL